MATVVNPVPAPSGKQITVGVALSATELCVVRRAASGARGELWRAPLHPLNGDGSGWPALTALMPPLTEIRRLDLPPMGDGELRQLLSRNAARYFVGARAAQLVGTTMAPQRQSGPVGGVIAAAVPLRLVAALHIAAREAGWTVDTVSPAEGAWCAAASTLWPATSRHAAHLLVCGEDRTELLQIDQGRLAGLRRFRAGAADAALITDAIGPAPAAPKTQLPARVVAVGASGPRKELARALTAAGLTVASAPAEWAERADHADLLAAEFAGPNAAPLLRSEATLASRRAHASRVIMQMAAASALLLLLAGAFTLWGAKRQLRAVQAERAAIKPLISATLVGRTSVETAFRQLSSLAAAQRSAVQWSAIVAGVSEHLDDQAYLTSMRGRDDSLLVEGIAVRASKAFDSFASTPGLSGVHAAAPVRRESPQGAAAVERFTIAALVKNPGAVSGSGAPATAAAKVSP
jgi:hypothetical protein